MNITAFYSLDQLVTVTISRTSAQTSGEGGMPTETPSEVDTKKYMAIEKLSGSQVRRAFGAKSAAIFRAFASSDEDVVEHDFITITSGPYAGVIMEVDFIQDPAGELKILALKTPTRKTA